MHRSLTWRAAVLAAAFVSSSVALAQQPSEQFAPGATPLHLRYGAFDPAKGAPQVPATLRGDTDTKLWIVQFDGRPTAAGRAKVVATGAEIHGYVPENGYVVRADHGVAAAVAQVPDVGFVDYYHPAYRLEPVLIAEHLSGLEVPTRRYNAVVVDKHNDKPALARKTLAIGGRIDHEQPGSLLFQVTLTGAQLLQFARFDEVLWVDRWSPPAEDMDNARSQGGGDFVEAQGGYTGAGLNGHLYEGIEATHPDFNTPGTAVRSCTSAASHGHATAGIVFGNGTSNPAVRGMAPDAVPFYTNYSCVSTGWSRWQVVSDLVNVHDVSFTTASWGNRRTRDYTSVSADADDIIFDHDIAWTQSQSNAGNQDSRPQAWAKNIFSIGGVHHGDNDDRTDDSWAAGGASTGPAADGRIKPTLCAYYDSIGTSDRSGSAGYSSGNWYSSFGGTSGATPIVAGHNALAIEMFTDFIFGNTPRVPGGSRHQNRPHFTTLKALMVANARQYQFTASSSDNRREHQGWGFPDLKTMYQNRNRMLIVDETAVLTQGQTASYQVLVQPGDPELKIALNHADPAANPAVTQTRINDLSLRVTSPSGTVYHGNHGLDQGNYSQSGGSLNTVDTIECVFVQTPEVGTWTVEVVATLIAQDSHVETTQTDADFALVATFGTVNGSITPFGQGCPGSGLLPNYCEQINGNGGTLSNASNSNEYAYPVVASSNLAVVGFELFTASTTGGSSTIPCSLYLDAGGQPSLTAAATGSMTVGSSPGFYSVSLNSTVNIPSGARFWVAHNVAAGCYLADLTGGTRVVGYWRRGTSGWSPSNVADYPSLHVLCQGGGGQTGAVPSFALDGKPGLGETLQVSLSRAAPSAPVALLSGVSNNQWSGGSLPFNLGAFGAPQCTLYVSPDISVGAAVNAQGDLGFPLGIPNQQALLGFPLYLQFLVFDQPANSLGAAFSNANHLVIGG